MMTICGLPAGLSLGQGRAPGTLASTKTEDGPSRPSPGPFPEKNPPACTLQAGGTRHRAGAHAPP